MNELEDTMLPVETGLGHRFADPRLLVDALTHSSFANENPRRVRSNNEVLEFLGDAVLQWAVSTLLFERFTGGTAGELTRRRADLVCEEGLAELARTVHIGPGLRLGKGEERTGGREKPRLLACAFEACVAAVYLDAGPDAVMDMCRVLFGPRADAQTPGSRDFKTRLQETLQRQGFKPPRYHLLATTGPDHERSFEVELRVDGEARSSGTGRSKLEAEQLAAAQALAQLEDPNEDPAAPEP